MAEIGQNIEKAAQLLENGELVGIPTETVYGLAGNALDEKVILKIFKTKKRPQYDPLISHIGSIELLHGMTENIPEIAFDLIDRYWPGPLTLLLPKRKEIPELLTSGLPRMAIRMPDHSLTKQLLKRLNFPLAAPSANPFGYVSPTSATHVENQLGGQIPYILDGGSTNIGIESTVIGFDEDSIIIHRLGGVTIEELRKFGKIRTELNQSGNPASPGKLRSHYAPGKPVIIGVISELMQENRNAGVISFKDEYPDSKKNIVLSKKGSLDEAACNLFAALRAMDVPDIDVIITEKFPEHGMGRAINDRLRRAASTYGL